HDDVGRRDQEAERAQRRHREAEQALHGSPPLSRSAFSTSFANASPWEVALPGASPSFCGFCTGRSGEEKPGSVERSALGQSNAANPRLLTRTGRSNNGCLLSLCAFSRRSSSSRVVGAVSRMTIS